MRSPHPVPPSLTWGGHSSRSLRSQDPYLEWADPLPRWSNDQLGLVACHTALAMRFKKFAKSLSIEQMLQSGMGWPQLKIKQPIVCCMLTLHWDTTQQTSWLRVQPRQREQNIQRFHTLIDSLLKPLAEWQMMSVFAMQDWTSPVRWCRLMCSRSEETSTQSQTQVDHW